MLVEFEMKKYTESHHYILFVVSSIFMTLVMFNVVIAIMGDTYSRIISQIQETDGRQLNTLILNQEELYFWKRHSGLPTYIYNLTYSINKKKQWISGPDFITS